MEVIHMWSCPSSLSTKMMYSFAQRDDVEVLDEPLYANFLRVTGADRPYREEVITKMEADGNKVIQFSIYGPGVQKYRFCKHMSKQFMPDLSPELLRNGKHFILIQSPCDIVSSLDKIVPASFLELGLGKLVDIYNDLSALGKPPVVIDAQELQKDHEGTLRRLCEDLGIPFQDEMLKWDVGPKPVDGIWAPWWYRTEHKSTGFAEAREYPVPLRSSLHELLETSFLFYNFLKCHAKRLPCPTPPVSANEKLLVWVGDKIVPRDLAKVSVFDGVVQFGGGAWEGLRIYDGKIFKFEDHIERLFDSAEALMFTNVPTREEVMSAVFKTLIINGMFDNAYVWLSLARGKKVETNGMSPCFDRYGCTLIVYAEWMPLVHDNAKGMTLVTVPERRHSSNFMPSTVRHNYLLSNIIAKGHADVREADDGIMLDVSGFVSGTTSANIFLKKNGLVKTPHYDCCFTGVTREIVIDLLAKKSIIPEEGHIVPSDLYTADEVWTTCTRGEVSPVTMIDGRVIGDGEVGKLTRELQISYRNLTKQCGVPIPTYDKISNLSEVVTHR